MAAFDLNDKPIEIMLAAHAIGLGHWKPYIRHGKMFYKPYRNVFSTTAMTDDFKVWRSLTIKGYANERVLSPCYGKTASTFWLTRKGLEWLGDELGITIHDEEK